MEVNSTEQTSASMDTSAPSTESTAPVDSSLSAASTPSGEQIPQTEGQEAPAYQPNYKFKVMDKEHEIDEWLRPAIKSPEHEQKLKEIYEKAFGLDEVKTGREKVREEYKTYRSQVDPTIKTITQASQLYHGGVQALEQGNPRAGVFKMEEAFKQLGINDKVLQQYVFHKLNMEDLPPDRKAEYNEYKRTQLEYERTQAQVAQQQEYIQAMAAQTRTAELHQATSRPEVATIVQAFDQRNGPGSFHDEVIARGQLYWQTRQVDVPAEQLVQEIINKYGLHGSQQAATPQAAQSNPQQPGKVPVIPSAKGSSASPAGRGFESLDDVKKYTQQEYGY